MIIIIQYTCVEYTLKLTLQSTTSTCTVDVHAWLTCLLVQPKIWFLDKYV